MKILRAALLICLTGFAAPANAQDPQVEVTLDPQASVTVGTPLTVRINVLVPNYMLKPPQWPDLQIADAITRNPHNAARPGSRRIDGQSYSVVSRVYEISPQRAADFTVDAQKIPVTYADPQTNQPVEAEAEMPAFEFSGIVPKGAEGLSPFIAADTLTMTEKIEGPGDDPQPGSAVTRTVTIEAQGTQAMLLPPVLSADAPAGLRAYPREPDLTDVPGERGAPAIARRVESVTYVAEAPGDYALPATRLDWWNSSSAAVQTAATDGVSFSIPAPPGWHPPGTPDPRRGPLLWGAGILLAALAAFWFARPLLHARWLRATRSEPVVFRRLLRHVRHGEIGQTRAMLPDWLLLIGQEKIPAPVESALDAAERDLWGPDGRGTLPSDTSRTRLAHALKATRHDARLVRRKAETDALPPLNPWQDAATR